MKRKEFNQENKKSKSNGQIAKMIYKFLLIIILLLSPDVSAQEIHEKSGNDSIPQKIIYETDMCADVDDVGGLAILNALANMGEAEILAVCYNEVHPGGATAIDAINTWYRRGDIPIGVYKGNLFHPDYSNYLNFLKVFPHDLDNTKAPSALDVYRHVLSEQPDSSVTIISVGFLNNLNDLLLNEPNLIARKVQKLVVMGGIHNDGFNLVRHNLVNASENVIKNWPTPIVFSQEGGNIHTGDNLKYAPKENPVREAYFRYFGGEFYGRPSWDPMAVLYGVRGLSYYFNEISTGTGSLSNGYVWQMKPGFRSYLRNRLPNTTFEQIIKKLMEVLPIGAHFEMSPQYGWAPVSVDFDGSRSIVGANHSIQQFLWNFGDGTTGEGEKVSHLYNESGNYFVQLIIVDEKGDSSLTSDLVHVFDPIFSLIEYYGDANNYLRNQESLWSTQLDNNDLRYFLSNDKRSTETLMPGFCFIKDSTYSDFTLNLMVRTGENLSQNANADYSIIFGYQDEKNYNYILMKHTTSRLVNVSNGQSIDLGRASKGIPDEDYHQVRLRRLGDQLTVLLDGNPFLTASSSRLPQDGKIGFGSNKCSVFFDNIQFLQVSTSISKDVPKGLPSQLKLKQNYPNPFNPSTMIRFELPHARYVVLSIFDIRGRKIRVLLEKKLTSGYYTIPWDGLDDHGRNVASGVYVAQLSSGDITKNIKITLIR